MKSIAGCTSNVDGLNQPMKHWMEDLFSCWTATQRWEMYWVSFDLWLQEAGKCGGSPKKMAPCLCDKSRPVGNSARTPQLAFSVADKSSKIKKKSFENKNLPLTSGRWNDYSRLFSLFHSQMSTSVKTTRKRASKSLVFFLLLLLPKIKKKAKLWDEIVFV